MRPINFIAIIVLLTLSSCNQNNSSQVEEEKTEHKYTNHLINESSPYLLQHAHNPVDWYPWGKEALDKAKAQNKLIIISVGYAACHWCHVMEHESFEDTVVAKFMNDHFVSIKIDREERPDIDQIYMDAVQLLTGSGGWPLNCIALPDGRPFYGGTYFPKEQWLDLLTQMVNYAKENPSKIEEQAKLLTEGVKANELITKNSDPAEFTTNDLFSIFENWKQNIDFTKGGSKSAPKFPMPVAYQYLMSYHYLTNDVHGWKAVEASLNNMARGGIYDQIGGGFSRYATDENWNIPHFEKMLYDNAQLVSLYSAAYQKTKNQEYKRIVEQTLTFIERELTSPEGGFYSSLDADTEGEEGKYYVWNADEMKNILGRESGLIIEYYNVVDSGNWEHGKNILFKSGNDKKIAAKYKITETELLSKVNQANEALLKARSLRVAPGLDDKILTSWNALMLKAYVDAYRVFDDPNYLKKAIRSANFINTKAKGPDNRLNRNYKNKKSSINGFLDDYAFSIQAFIALYQATFDEKWLQEALALTEYTITHFHDSTSGMFYYTSDIDDKLIVRKMEVTDNVIPASNSEMAKNLYILGQYFYKDDYIKMARTMLNNVKPDALKGRSYFANWDILMTWFISEPYEVAIVGIDFESKRKEFDQHYLPFVFLSGGKNEGNLALLENKLMPGSTTIYVCQNKSCRLPVTEVKAAISQMAR